jgi:hypothetical protein
MTTKPNFKDTSANAAISVSDDAIDSQVGGEGAEVKKTREELYGTMSKVDRAVKDQASGGSGTP